jgi:hypothetical protein
MPEDDSMRPWLAGLLVMSSGCQLLFDVDVTEPVSAGFIADGDEDADGNPNATDPCPISDTDLDDDGDGVGNGCDPTPQDSTDCIILFDGFEDGLDSRWQGGWRIEDGALLDPDGDEESVFEWRATHPFIDLVQTVLTIRRGKDVSRVLLFAGLDTELGSGRGCGVEPTPFVMGMTDLVKYDIAGGQVVDVRGGGTFTVPLAADTKYSIASTLDRGAGLDQCGASSGLSGAGATFAKLGPPGDHVGFSSNEVDVRVEFILGFGKCP